MKQLHSAIKRARAQKIQALVTDRLNLTDGIDTALLALYDLLYLETLTKESEMTNQSQLRLVTFGANSHSQLMDNDQYMNWLAVCTSDEFDSHVAVTVNLDAETTETFKDVLSRMQPAAVTAKLKLVGGAK